MLNVFVGGVCKIKDVNLLRIAWGKFRELSYLLSCHIMSLKLHSGWCNR